MITAETFKLSRVWRFDDKVEFQLVKAIIGVSRKRLIVIIHTADTLGM